jgi:hypothetical protein
LDRPNLAGAELGRAAKSAHEARKTITAAVPVASTVDAIMSKSNFGPAVSFSFMACGIAATITAVLPALWAALQDRRIREAECAHRSGQTFTDPLPSGSGIEHAPRDAKFGDPIEAQLQCAIDDVSGCR